MKTRLFSLLLVVALLVTCAAFAVEAAETCPGCGATVESWEALPVPENTSGANVLAAGHYKLDSDVSFGTGRYNISGTSDVTKVVCIDLNGHTITSTGVTAFSVSSYSKLYIMDSSAGQTGKIDGRIGVYETTSYFKLMSGTLTRTPAFGSQGGAVLWVGNGTVDMVGGTITGGKIGGKAHGGNVGLGGTSVFNMSGGTISDGQTTGTGHGGNVAIFHANARFNMTDGTVTGGQSTNGSNGGNFYVNAGQLNISGGTVSDGAAGKFYGGNIMAMGGTTTISGGTITGGVAPTYGGNICVRGASTVCNISGDALITQGKSPSGANIAVHSGTLNVNGGTISDGRHYTSGSVTGYNIFTVSGQTQTLNFKDCEIVETDGRGTNVYLQGQATTSVTLDGAARIGQLAINGAEGSTAPITVKAGFNGRVTLRYLNGTIYNAITYGTLLPNVTAEAGWKSKGTLIARSGNTTDTLANAREYAVDGGDGNVYVYTAMANSYNPETKAYTLSYYYGMQAAANAANADTTGNTFVRMFEDVEDAGTITGDLYINMNGFNIGTLTVTGGKLRMYDATGMLTDTEGYTGIANYTGEVEAFVPSVAGTMFMNIQDGAAVTTHRVLIEMNKVALKPDADNGTDVAITYKPQFYGDAAVAAYINGGNAAYGIEIGTEQYPAAIAQNIAGEFISGEAAANTQVILSGFFPGNIGVDNKIVAAGYIKVGEEYYKISAPLYSLKEIMGLYDAAYATTQDSTAKAMLEAMYRNIADLQGAEWATALYNIAAGAQA